MGEDARTQEVLWERTWVLLFRQVIILGGLTMFLTGFLPAMDKSEVVINTLMWIFVAVVHSWREGSLSNAPGQYLDTLFYRHAGGARDATASAGNAIGLELSRCYDSIREVSTGKLVHKQQNAKRKSDLHEFQIREAVFDVLYVDDLEEVLRHTCYTCYGDATAFDDTIVRLQGILPRPFQYESKQPTFPIHYSSGETQPVKTSRRPFPSSFAFQVCLAAQLRRRRPLI